MDLFKNHANTQSPSAIWLLIGLNTLVFILQVLNRYSTQGGASGEIEPTKGTLQAALQQVVKHGNIEDLALVPSHLYNRPVENAPTLVSSMFAHANLSHLLLNMLGLYQFGRPLQSKLGFWKTLAIYLAGGVGSNLIYSLTHPTSDTGLIGASAGVSAVLMAYLVEFGK